LFPYIVKTRRDLNYEGLAILLLDGCTSHGSDWFLDACEDLGMIPVFLPPHSSDQTQPMDLGIFAVQKVEAKRIRPSDKLNIQTRQVIKVVGSYMKACIPNNITSAFRRAGILAEYSPRHGALLARVAREEANCVRDWAYQAARVPLTGEPFQPEVIETFAE
jgi:hypothetical protein